mgnify:CR=1 FL=1
MIIDIGMMRKMIGKNMNKRHTKITWEIFEKLKDELDGTPINVDDIGFWRTFEFEALGQKYQLKYFKNLCNLYIGGFQLIATHASIDGCWPNIYKKNLNLGNETEVLAVIPLEKYE